MKEERSKLSIFCSFYDSMIYENAILQIIKMPHTGFAAGAMIYVVVEELIPEMSEGNHSNIGTIFFAAVFSIMMMLDVARG